MDNEFRNNLLYALVIFAIGIPLLLLITFYYHINNFWLDVIVVFLFFGWINLLIDYINEMKKYQL